MVELMINLIEFEDKIPDDTKRALFYIAGYITRHDPEYSEEELLEVTTFYSTKYGNYTGELDRGHLNVPDDRSCQWTFLCYVMFTGIKNDVCRVSLSKVFLEISDEYDFGMKMKHARILANILLNNLCKSTTPRDSKESSFCYVICWFT